jgi:hypothetical protein
MSLVTPCLTTNHTTQISLFYVKKPVPGLRPESWQSATGYRSTTTISSVAWIAIAIGCTSAAPALDAALRVCKKPAMSIDA